MPWLRFMLTSIIGAFLWATLFGLTAYSLGQQVARLAGWMVLVFGLGILKRLTQGTRLRPRQRHWGRVYRPPKIWRA